MIKGLFLDPRSWEIDFRISEFWNPQKYGLDIQPYPDAFNIYKKKRVINKDIKFVLTSEVWEKIMRDTLNCIRKQGIKVFLIAREPIKYGDLIDAMFNCEKYNFGGQYYFTPDVVLAAGEKYSKLWENKTKVYITGYPRWDWYISNNKPTKHEVFKRYGLDNNKKVIFFPSYPPYHYKKQGNKDTMVDLYSAREDTLKTISNFTKLHSQYQFVAKIHPMSMKCYLKKIGRGDEVSGLLKKYYKTPTDYFKVIGDNRMKGNISKEILLHSDLVVGYNSTMLLEAAVLGKPVIQVMFGDCANLYSPYNNTFLTAYNDIELVDLLEKYSQGMLSFGSASKDARSYLHDIDGLSCKRICEVIKNEL
jgi:hypothetical protein